MLHKQLFPVSEMDTAIRVLLKHTNVLFCVIFIVVSAFKYSFGIQSCSRVRFKTRVFLILQSFCGRLCAMKASR